MQRTYARLRTGFLVLFLLLTSAVAAYQIYVVRPAQRCERGGGWWDPGERICATPLDITRVTRRARGEPRAAPEAALTPPASPPAATARP